MTLDYLRRHEARHSQHNDMRAFRLLISSRHFQVPQRLSKAAQPLFAAIDFASLFPSIRYFTSIGIYYRRPCAHNAFD